MIRADWTRRDVLRAALAGCAASALPAGRAPAAPVSPTGRPPNIVYFILDELAYRELSCMGQEKFQTPHMDRVAREGMRFTQCLAGAPLCAPTRSTLMTGQHTGHTSVRTNPGWESLRADDVTVAEVLKQAGYACGGFGKWGLGDAGTTGVPEKHGFDVFYGYYHQVHAHSYYPRYLLRNGVKVPLKGNTGEFETGKQFSQYLIFKETLKFIRANKDRPFFCYCPYTPPHYTCALPKDDPSWQKYKDKDLGGEKGKAEAPRLYAAMVDLVDRQIGRILDLIKELGLDDNTLVFVSGDNGGAKYCGDFSRGNDPFRGRKGNLYEGGLRVPYLVRWPGHIAAGSVSDLLGYFPDVLPTLAELAGAKAPANIDGLSFVPTLLGESAAGRKQPTHEYLYWESGDSRAVRMGNWKAILPAGDKADKNAAPPENPQPPTWELYDLAKDISEQTNVAGTHGDILQKMIAFAGASHTEHRPGGYVEGGEEMGFKGHKAD